MEEAVPHETWINLSRSRDIGSRIRSSHGLNTFSIPGTDSRLSFGCQSKIRHNDHA